VTTSVVVYDDAVARRFAPFSLTRPLAAMRAGAELIGQRWADALRVDGVSALSSPHLDGFTESGVASASGILAPGTIVASSRCVVAIGSQATIGDAWRVGDNIGAVRLAKAIPAEAFRDGTIELTQLVSQNADVRALNGRWIGAPWDLIGQLPAQLAEDTHTLAASIEAGERRLTNPHSVLGEHRVIIEAGANIEPHVVFDATAGAIVIREDAHISAFTRIAGPCIIGRGTHVLGGRISGSAIGDDCRVHGDVSASIFVGHANKAHEGFVGHSVIGRWANLGAGTTTSNLKNSYGAVRMWTPDGERGTDLTFLGSLIGDHAKLGIGTMLGTGTVIGAGANVFGAVIPPKRVRPFAWGESPPYETFELPKFVEVATRVMERRKAALDAGMKRVLAAAHELSTTDEW
jgi:UDP-N-acetylglucosamine diphosphorylase / glucose-1-phosphate thymidylyltransferase / UDP-N-acetylgalactosamine diphosphorylase / glucosamine-1-phosphate N-acetyltransferase / galactosamine-1-phosphate N-acetyltransferase